MGYAEFHTMEDIIPVFIVVVLYTEVASVRS
jgi:hypothetical protein